MSEGERDAGRFGKVAVVMGGWSAEREVSLMSGEQVFDALSSIGIDAHAVDAGQDIGRTLVEGGFARAFLILHGRGGEDGTVQGVLDLAGMPYTGSGVLGSALAMDKWRAKALCTLAGLPTPAARLARDLGEARAAAREIGLPLVVKPVSEGSSLGVSMVDDEASLAPAFESARRYGAVMLERRLPGPEVTVGIVGDEVLPPVTMRAASGFYDYHAKYVADDTEYLCPAPLPEETLARLAERARTAFDALGCRGWGRVDFMLDETGEPHFIECNTAPGMTSHSLVPTAARVAGMTFPALCERILEQTLRPEDEPRQNGSRPEDEASPAPTAFDGSERAAPGRAAPAAGRAPA